MYYHRLVCYFHKLYNPFIRILPFCVFQVFRMYVAMFCMLNRVPNLFWCFYFVHVITA